MYRSRVPHGCSPPLQGKSQGGDRVQDRAEPCIPSPADTILYLESLRQIDLVIGSSFLPPWYLPRIPAFPRTTGFHHASRMHANPGVISLNFQQIIESRRRFRTL